MKRIALTVAAVLFAASAPVDGSDLTPVTDLRVVGDYRAVYEVGDRRTAQGLESVLFHCVDFEWTYDVSAQADVLREIGDDASAVDAVTFFFEYRETGTEDWIRGDGSGSGHTRVPGTGYPGMAQHQSFYCAAAEDTNLARSTTFGSYLFRIRVCPQWHPLLINAHYPKIRGSCDKWGGTRWVYDPIYASEPGNAVQVAFSDGSPDAPTLTGQVLDEPGTAPVVHLGWASVRGVVGGEPPTSYRVIAKRKRGKWATAATVPAHVDGDIAAGQTWLAGLARGLWRFRVEALNQYGKRRSNMVSLNLPDYDPSSRSSAQLDVTIRRGPPPADRPTQAN